MEGKEGREKEHWKEGQIQDFKGTLSLFQCSRISDRIHRESAVGTKEQGQTGNKMEPFTVPPCRCLTLTFLLSSFPVFPQRRGEGLHDTDVGPDHVHGKVRPQPVNVRKGDQRVREAQEKNDAISHYTRILRLTCPLQIQFSGLHHNLPSQGGREKAEGGKGDTPSGTEDRTKQQVRDKTRLTNLSLLKLTILSFFQADQRVHEAFSFEREDQTGLQHLRRAKGKA